MDDVTDDCVIIVAVACVTRWSFESLKFSTIVRFVIVADEFFPNELFISSLVPPGSSKRMKKLFVFVCLYGSYFCVLI